jgi:hypothetical protein
MRIRATVVKALAAGALLAGVVGVAGAGVASASTPLNPFYVATNGSSNPNNSCTNKAAPCQSITQALGKAASANPSGPNTIIVAKGVYTGSLNNPSLTSNNNTTIVGAVSKKGAFKVTVDVSGTVDVTGTTDSISDIAISETGAPAVGIELGGPTDSITTDSYSTGVGGTPATTAAVLAESGGTVSSVIVNGTACTDTTKTDLPVGAQAGTLVGLKKKLPKCAEPFMNPSTVSIGGNPESVDTAGNKNLELASANGAATDTPVGSTVSFASTLAAYSAAGVIVADGAVVENSTINGSGVSTQTGIEVGALGTATGNKVNGNGTAGISTEIPAGGTATIGGTAPGAGNSGSSNAAGIAVDGVDTGGGSVAVTDNSVGGVNVGISASCITTGTVSFTGNTASESAEEGAGITLLGVQDTTWTSNSTSGTIALLVATGGPNVAAPHNPPSDECSTASTGNHFTSNTVDNGLLLGAVITGQSDPTDVTALLGGLGVVTMQAGNSGNIFNGNTWSGNGEANIVDLSAFDSQVQPACAGVSDVTLAGAIAPGTSITSVSLKSTQTCTLNPGTNLTDVNPASTIEQTLYITSSCTLLSTDMSGTTCSVSNFIPLASSQLNPATNATPPGTGGSVGDGIGVDVSGVAHATTNTYGNVTPNNVEPDFNGSSTLDAATGSGGYYSA